jgi:hypothetical protein
MAVADALSFPLAFPFGYVLRDQFAGSVNVRLACKEVLWHHLSDPRVGEQQKEVFRLPPFLKSWPGNLNVTVREFHFVARLVEVDLAMAPQIRVFLPIPVTGQNRPYPMQECQDDSCWEQEGSKAIG